MNFKLIACVAFAVLVAYMAIFHIIDTWKQMGEPPRALPPGPNFTTTTYRYQDEQGRDVKVEREYKVTTRLADEETLKKLPPPPAPRTEQ
jgi:hypothetical protein